MAENAVNQTAAAAKVDGAESWRRGGPRTLLLKRCEAGYGFTLRHFIIYPPESYSLCEGGGAMDTIFVKHVQPGGPAHEAGLATGDRLVMVNGENISGVTYARVVQVIQQAGNYLQLTVVPRQADILQLYFGATAHNPETNQRATRLRSPDTAHHNPSQPRTKAVKHRQSLDNASTQSRQVLDNTRHSLERPWQSLDNSQSYAAARVCDNYSQWSEDSSDSFTDSRSSVRSSSKSRDRSLDNSQSGGRTREGSQSGDRTRESSEGFHSSWGRLPNIAALDNHVLTSSKDSVSSADSSATLRDADDAMILSRLRRSFQQKEAFLSRPADSSAHAREFYARPQQRLRPVWPPEQPRTEESLSDPGSQDRHRILSRIQESQDGALSLVNGFPPQQPSCSEEANRFVAQPLIQLVARRARQFESGRADEDRTALYRSELARLGTKSGVPNVALRRREIEARQEQMSRSTRMQEGTEAMEMYCNSDSSSKSGSFLTNQTTLIGTTSIHCQPPPECSEQDGPMRESCDLLRPMTESARHKAVRQDSYLTAVRSQALNTPVIGSGLSSCREEPPLTRPTHLDIPHPLLPATPPSTPDSLPDPPTPASTPDNNETTTVVRRQKTPRQTQMSDEDRLRRTSYLKATNSDRMNVDSDHDSDAEQQNRLANRKWRPPMFPDDVAALREFFESEPIAAQRGRAEVALDDKENAVVREGWLNCKVTLQEGKRSTERSWRQVWAVVHSQTLHLYKDRHTTAHENDRLSLPLPGSQSELAQGGTKKKHALRLNTLIGTELLLQAEDAPTCGAWLNTIQEQADCSGAKGDAAQQSKGLRKLTSFRSRSPTGQSPASKTPKPSQDALVSSPKSKTWKGRVARQLRRMHASPTPASPTAPPDGAAIGVPLHMCPASEANPYLPQLVVKCTEVVEERGLDIIGIYRVPGNTAAVSSLTEAVNKGFQFTDYQDQRWTDVNVISSLLKLFFRRLPDALLTSELYPQFIRADKCEDPNTRITLMRRLVHDLPDHHYETLKHLCLHLQRVVQHSSVNKMEARNLAIVFGPTLVRTAGNNMVTMVTDMSHQCRIVESLLLYTDWFFSDEEDVESFPFALDASNTLELEASAMNPTLLLSNIEKVEGMKLEGKESLAKAIGSSIISAASRKMQKSRGRKGSGQSAASNGDETPQPVRSKEQDEAGSEQPSAAEQAEPTPEPVAATETETESGTIRTYAGLSATTQERIRRFELETKAMLQRDLSRQRRDNPEDPTSPRSAVSQSLVASPLTVTTTQPARQATNIRVNPLATRDHDESVSSVEPSDLAKPTHEVAARTEVTREVMRRGSSAENIAAGVGAAPGEAQKLGALKRFKSGKEQLTESLRCGSLDSLQEVLGERPPSELSDDGSDLLSSLTSAFDRKLKTLLSPEPEVRATSPEEAPEKETTKTEASTSFVQVSTPSLKTDVTRSSFRSKIPTYRADKEAVRRRWMQEGGGKEEEVKKEEVPGASDVTEGPEKKRDAEKEEKSATPDTQESLKKKDPRLKRSDSLTKTEKTESNIKRKEKLKRKNGMPDRSIKRRHTVGGTQDLDKMNWLDNRFQEEGLDAVIQQRTSSPDLSWSRRPHSLLESHV